MLNPKWWRATCLQRCSWMYWVDPYSVVRVSQPPPADQRAAKPVFPPPIYYIDMPHPNWVDMLKQDGWTLGATPGYFNTSNQVMVALSLGKLGLSLPEWNGNYCYRVYWREPVFYI